MSAWVYDGASWRNLNSLWVYDGGTWRKASQGWVYDGATWRQFLAPCTATLDTVTQNSGSDGGDGCGAGKCYRCVEWTYSNATDTDYHIRILKSTSGGSYFEVADDLSLKNACSATAACSRNTFADEGCYADTCVDGGISTQYKIRLEVDGGDSLACGDSNNEKTTASISTCGGGAS